MKVFYEIFHNSFFTGSFCLMSQYSSIFLLLKMQAT